MLKAKIQLICKRSENGTDGLVHLSLDDKQ